MSLTSALLLVAGLGPATAALSLAQVVPLVVTRLGPQRGAVDGRCWGAIQ